MFNRRMERNNIGRTHTDGSGFISEDLASQCPKHVIQGKHLSNQICLELHLQICKFDCLNVCLELHFLDIDKRSCTVQAIYTI